MFGLLKEIASFAFGWFKNKQELAAEVQKTKVMIEQNKQRLAVDKQQFNHTWEMEALKNGDKLIRRLSFFMFSAPFIIAIFAPHHIQIYFEETISVVPKFWQDAWIGITGSVWGISSLKDAIPAVIKGFRK